MGPCLSPPWWQAQLALPQREKRSTKEARRESGKILIWETRKRLRRRKRFLVSQIKIFPDSLRASLVERFSRCGKANCACHHGGDKHGPFYYLTQCLAAGKMNKFLLKTPAQRQIAQAGI